jgi:hypothetical protein
MSEEKRNVFALLVGINEYSNRTEAPLLGGCVNDVHAVAQLLRDRFDVPAAHVQTLVNSEATHHAIRAAFRSHLIQNARVWAEGGATGEPPAFLFHYSGHGAQAIDETGVEPDGFDETIVPYDSRTPGVYDIKDWELGELLDDLTRYSDNVTVVLDCCHSGSGTRAADVAAVPTRRCPPDLRPQPTQRPGTRAAGTRALATPSGWREATRYVLIAACRDREEANEYRAQDEQGRQQYGALTYFLVQALSGLSGDRPLTYAELHERLGLSVNAIYRDQMPQCEGDRDREVLGGLRPRRDVWLTVVDKREGFVWIDGGIVHGLTQGTQLQVFPPQTRTLEEASGPLAMLEVQEVGVVQSACSVVQGAADVPLLAKVAVHKNCRTGTASFWWRGKCDTSC